MASTSVTMSDTGVPLGVLYAVGGPGRYEFLIEGLLVRGGGDHNAALKFKLKSASADKVFSVYIRITGARHVQTSACPPFPSEAGARNRDHEDLWDGVWEFTGYCPGQGIPVRGLYSPLSRNGVVFLWQAHVDDYGCDGCRRDLHRFFADPDVRTGLLALERAKTHMFCGSIVGELYNRCENCLELFRELRQSCELP